MLLEERGRDFATTLLAARGWDPDLHPRGRDGRFIDVFGWIDALFDGEWHRAEVEKITPDSRAPGSPRIFVKTLDNRTHVVRPDSVRSAVKPKASLLPKDDKPKVYKPDSELSLPDRVEAARAIVHGNMIPLPEETQQFYDLKTEARSVRNRDAVKIFDRSKTKVPSRFEALQDELEEALDILDAHGVEIPARLKVEMNSGTQMRKYGKGKGAIFAKAPTAVASGDHIHMGMIWKDTGDWSLSRNRLETLLHEIGHVLDPGGSDWGVPGSHGTKGRDMRRDIDAPSDYAKTSDHEFFAEAFLATMTGRASPELAEAVMARLQTYPVSDYTGEHYEPEEGIDKAFRAAEQRTIVAEAREEARELADIVSRRAVHGSDWTRTGGRGSRDGFGTELDVEPIARFDISDESAEELRNIGVTVQSVYEIDDPEIFRERVLHANQTLKFGASVTPYSVEDYSDGTRMFLFKDGTAGFGITPDGQVISVFNVSDDNTFPLHLIMPLALSEGATRADAFDTVLPSFYADFGFQPTARIPFDEDYEPVGWDYDTYRKFNNGRPDVVFLRFDPDRTGVVYKPGDGDMVDDYNAGLNSTLPLPREVVTDGSELDGLGWLEVEARKYDTFEDFERAFNHDIARGVYWHITDNPHWEFDSKIAPRDMSSMGDGGGTPGALMVTSDLGHWDSYYNEDEISRPYAVQIDLSKIDPSRIKQVNRGFGNEIWIAPEDADKVEKVRLLPREEAIRFDDTQLNLPFRSSADLREWWDNRDPEFITGRMELDTDYRGEHQPTSDGAQASDLSQLVQEDIYTHPHYFFDMKEPYNREGIEILRGVRGQPEADITIYRALPADADSDEINPGDWVTQVHSYAVLHGEGNLGGQEIDGEWVPNEYKILERTVKAGDLRWSADSMVEFGWFPEDEPAPDITHPSAIPVIRSREDIRAEMIGHLDMDEYKGWSEEDQELLSEYLSVVRREKEKTVSQMSAGLISPERVKELGYDDRLPGQSRDDKTGRPDEPTYHVTTSATSIQNLGLLTKTELREEGIAPAGIGGGPEAISLTTDLQMAREYLQQFQEAHRVANGEISIEDMISMARAGVDADTPYLDGFYRYYDHTWKPGDPRPETISNAIFGRKREFIGMGRTLDEMIEEHGDLDWVPVPGTSWEKKDGTLISMSWTRVMTEQEKAESVMDVFNIFTAHRSHAGGPADVSFFGEGRYNIGAQDPNDIKILVVEPTEQAYGYQPQGTAEAEWRFFAGSVLPVTGWIGEDNDDIMKLGEGAASVEPEVSMDFDPLDHPRGSDGKFIQVFSWVEVSSKPSDNPLDDDYRGTVKGIYDDGLGTGDLKVVVEFIDGEVFVDPSEIRSPDSKDTDVPSDFTILSVASTKWYTRLEDSDGFGLGLAAVQSYTVGGYDPMNAHLLGESPSEYLERIGDGSLLSIEDRVSNIEPLRELIASYDGPVPKTVWRAFRTDYDTSEFGSNMEYLRRDLDEAAVHGGTFRHVTFASTTIEPYFLTTSDGVRTDREGFVMEIRPKSGAPLMSRELSILWDQEQEWLMPDGLEFRVLGKEDRDGVTYYIVEEVEVTGAEV